MCRRGCFEIQINEQSREFVNEVCKQLHELTGVELRVTSVYQPQTNGFVELENRTIKNSLVKVLEDHPEMWPQIIEGSFLLITLVDILLTSTLHSCWCITASQFCKLMWSITWTKMKTKNEKTEKGMGTKSNHSMSTFLMPSLHQRQKFE